MNVASRALNPDDSYNSRFIRFSQVTWLSRKALMLFILLLPFQGLPRTILGSEIRESAILKLVAYSDEIIAILFFIILSSFVALRPRRFRMNIIRVPLTVPVSIFIMISVASILVNHVGFLQGAFGVYDMLKNLVVIYLFTFFRWKRRELVEFVNGIKAIMVILILAGVAGELLALYGNELGGFVMGEEKKRLGFYRVLSLTGAGSSNYLGMYALLGMFLFYSTAANRGRMMLGVLSSLILLILTFSRQAWVGLVVMMVSRRKIFIIPSILIFVMIGYMASREVDIISDPEKYFRLFTYTEALRLYVNNLILGVGPGMFGGLSSIMFDSVYYSNWPFFFKEFLLKTGSIDSFWPVILAETGSVGFVAYVMIFIALYGWITKAFRWYEDLSDDHMIRIGRIVRNYLIVIAIMCFFTGFNKPFVTYTFFALCGMFLSVYSSEKEETPK